MRDAYERQIASVLEGLGTRDGWRVQGRRSLFLHAGFGVDAHVFVVGGGGARPRSSPFTHHHTKIDPAFTFKSPGERHGPAAACPFARPPIPCAPHDQGTPSTATAHQTHDPHTPRLPPRQSQSGTPAGATRLTFPIALEPLASWIAIDQVARPAGKPCGSHG